MLSLFSLDASPPRAPRSYPSSLPKGSAVRVDSTLIHVWELFEPPPPSVTVTACTRCASGCSRLKVAWAPCALLERRTVEDSKFARREKDPLQQVRRRNAVLDRRQSGRFCRALYGKWPLPCQNHKNAGSYARLGEEERPDKSFERIWEAT